MACQSVRCRLDEGHQGPHKRVPRAMKKRGLPGFETGGTVAERREAALQASADKVEAQASAPFPGSLDPWDTAVRMGIRAARDVRDEGTAYGSRAPRTHSYIRARAKLEAYAYVLTADGKRLMQMGAGGNTVHAAENMLCDLQRRLDG